MEIEKDSLISVVLPTYNRGKTIERSITSVLEQTYQNIELIVVDDGSTDGTEKIVNRIQSKDKRINYIRYHSNQGACAARNTGIALAKGEYIAFQDSDDVWRKEKLNSQLYFINKYDADVCFCKIERHGYSGGIYCPNLDGGIIEYKDLTSASVVSTPTILARKEVFCRYCFDSAVKRLQDYDWVIRAGTCYKFCMDSEILVDVYLQMDSITLLERDKTIEMYGYFLKKYKNMFIDYPELRLTFLNNLGRNKLWAGQDASKEYREIFIHTRKLKDFLKFVSCKVGLLKPYWDFINKKSLQDVIS